MSLSKIKNLIIELQEEIEKFEEEKKPIQERKESIDNFIDLYCEINTEDKYKEGCTELYNKLVEYYNNNNNSSPPSKQKFREVLEQKGVKFDSNCKYKLISDRSKSRVSTAYIHIKYKGN